MKREKWESEEKRCACGAVALLLSLRHMMSVRKHRAVYFFGVFIFASGFALTASSSEALLIWVYIWVVLSCS